MAALECRPPDLAVRSADRDGSQAPESRPYRQLKADPESSHPFIRLRCRLWWIAAWPLLVRDLTIRVIHSAGA